MYYRFKQKYTLQIKVVDVVYRHKRYYYILLYRYYARLSVAMWPVSNVMKSYTQTKFKGMAYARSEFHCKVDPYMIGISDCIHVDSIILKQSV